MTKKILNRRNFLEASCKSILSVGVLSVGASAHAAPSYSKVDRDENFGRGEIHLTHDSPVVSKIDKSTVGIWIRLAPYKWKRDIDEIRLRMEIVASVSRKLILRKRLIALRDDAFIIRHAFKADTDGQSYTVNLYFSNELIAQRTFVI